MLSNIASSLLLASTGMLPFPRKPSNNTQDPRLLADPTFPWDDLLASETLVYQDCYYDFQCAMLQVPMDWNAEEGASNKTVEIAIVRLPATVPVTDPRYGGVVIVNPGGPGASGVETAVDLGKRLQTLVSAGPTADNQTAKYFDILSFDPRGVANTRPNFRCFPNSLERQSYETLLSAYGSPGSNFEAFSNIWTLQRTLADSCSKRAIEAGIGEHMSTSNVARDMIEIVERHGEWREQEARRLLKSSGSSDTNLLSRVEYQPGKEMVQFWGISYGTVLGATLADMYPKRVKRVVLDGVVDSFDWYKGELTANLQDTDLTISKFAEYCWLGGRENCALYHDNGVTFIAERFDNIMQKLLHNPVGLPGTDHTSAHLITQDKVRSVFFGMAYSALTGFGGFAELLAELERGEVTAPAFERRVTTFSTKKDLPELYGPYSSACKKEGPYSRACDPELDGASMALIRDAIFCTDAEDRTNTTKEEYWSYTQDMMEQSRVIGDAYDNRLHCTQWHARDSWRYEGDFNATTAHPILLLGNVVDPITPLRNAYKMSKGFRGSVVLALDIVGHASVNGVSFCASKAVRNYFQTGELPEVGTICPATRVPMDGFTEEDDHPLPKGETDEALWEAMVDFVS
ncbi:hypothetical protein M438DRAFT_393894 [Aureobasidium pullulans EXF-150]|uniref:Peptidase S33 tripeptidyl aminopeptidase-like C-terminal domain-containing protein n=1 Tax=Aureobasidium pullulans EXF-150 TaxID=1043002 RepID=A0A074YTI9_AURPU|nr:uncharacterized protein M438DRAFT_393894 [Aureobasidium pullulans EXF-150]KEQ90116.1 hypothetical protein M438DRAFT_393894 [Aureobasidium pullulans EXF-150]